MAELDEKTLKSDSSDVTLLMCALLMNGVKNKKPDCLGKKTKISKAKALDDAVLKAYKNVLKSNRENIDG